MFNKLDTRIMIAIVATILFILAAIPSIAVLNNNPGKFDDFLLNVATEMWGALVTFLLITLVLGYFQNRDSKAERLITRLMQEARSDVRNVAAAAIGELYELGVLTGGNLKGANLRNSNLGSVFHARDTIEESYFSIINLERANLSGVSLQGANLHQVNFDNVNLSGANLDNANLSGADMQSTNLTSATLNQASLQGAFLLRADLGKANLKYSDLSGAVLQGANLRDANLERADLSGVNVKKRLNVPLMKEFDFRPYMNEETTLPDGSYWTPDTDMARFTDPDHKDKNGNLDFWRPEPGSVWWYPETEGD